MVLSCMSSSSLYKLPMESLLGYRHFIEGLPVYELVECHVHKLNLILYMKCSSVAVLVIKNSIENLEASYLNVPSCLHLIIVSRNLSSF